MRKPDRTKINDIFGNGASVVVPASYTRRASKTFGSKKPPTAQERFLQKLQEGDFDLFDHRDWIEYFKHKAAEHGIKYIVGNAAKEQAIIKALMKELHWNEIKAMIDFLFDSNQDIVDKHEASIIHLSKGWINTIYQNSQKWLAGEYVPRHVRNQPKKRKREWEPVVASRKDSGIGIRYGKPVRDESDDDDDTTEVIF